MFLLKRLIFLPYHRLTQTCLRKVQVWKVKRLGSSWWLTTSFMCQTNHFVFICSEIRTTIKWRFCLACSWRHGSLLSEIPAWPVKCHYWCYQSNVILSWGIPWFHAKQKVSLFTDTTWAWQFMVVMMCPALRTFTYRVQPVVDLESLERKILIYRVSELLLKFQECI